MKLFNHDKGPIENVQLSSKHTTLRWIAVVVCLIIAVASIGYALNAMLTVNAGWQQIEDTSAGLNCGDDFMLQYDFGEGGSAATADKRRITTLYTEAVEKAFWMFSKDEAHETIVGLRAINDAPNTVLTVDPVLYNAFALMEQYGDRSLYLAPLYAEHDSMLATDAEVYAKMRDPKHDMDAAEYCRRVALYANDPQHIQVELLGNDQIRLYVSDEYLNWAEANAMDALVDFHWMKNAFIVDYIADTLMQNGYTKGTIASVDGYVCNLGAQGDFAVSIYDRPKDATLLAAQLVTRGRLSAVSLRSFPVAQSDYTQRYYLYEDGSIAAPHLNAQTGLRTEDVRSMTAYASDKGCAELMLELAPIFTMESPGEADARLLAEGGTHLIWCDGMTVFHTDPEVRLAQLYESPTLTYTAELFE